MASGHGGLQPVCGTVAGAAGGNVDARLGRASQPRAMRTGPRIGHL